MGRVKVNLTLDADVARTARSLGLNMSRLAEAAIKEAAKVERNRLWRMENQAAIDAYAEEVAKDGLPLAHRGALARGGPIRGPAWPHASCRSGWRRVDRPRSGTCRRSGVRTARAGRIPGRSPRCLVAHPGYPDRRGLRGNFGLTPLWHNLAWM